MFSLTFIPISNVCDSTGVYLLKTMTETASPSRTQKILPLLLLGMGLILIVAASFFILRDAPNQNDLSAVPVEVNFSSPDLTLADTQGVSRSLADYRGQVVLVNLWATWCPPCKAEMPTLQAFYNKYNAKGFVIIAINDGDPTKDVLQFVRDYKLSFPVWLDPTYIATEQAFKTLNLPTSFIIGRDGTVRLMWVGGISRKTLEKYVAPIILEKP